MYSKPVETSKVTAHARTYSYFRTTKRYMKKVAHPKEKEEKKPADNDQLKSDNKTKVVKPVRRVKRRSIDFRLNKDKNLIYSYFFEWSYIDHMNDDIVYGLWHLPKEFQRTPRKGEDYARVPVSPCDQCSMYWGKTAIHHGPKHISCEDRWERGKVYRESCKAISTLRCCLCGQEIICSRCNSYNRQIAYLHMEMEHKMSLDTIDVNQILQLLEDRKKEYLNQCHDKTVLKDIINYIEQGEQLFERKYGKKYPNPKDKKIFAMNRLYKYIDTLDQKPLYDDHINNLILVWSIEKDIKKFMFSKYFIRKRCPENN